MIEPVTALGLLANIVQLIDSGIRIADTTHEVATKGLSTDFRHCMSTAEHVSQICNDILAQTQSGTINNKSEEEAGLTHLAIQANGVASDLWKMMDELSLAQPSNILPCKRKRGSVASRVVRGLLKERDVKRLRARLNDLQQTMILDLSSLQRQATVDILQQLQKQGNDFKQEHRQLLLELEKLLIHFHTGAPSFLPTADSNAWHGCFHGYVRRLRTAVACNNILDSLAFCELHIRQDMIPEAHARTFQWIFDRDEVKFRHWAANKDGIFWITGKPGSGKSTLMKFLVRHHQTRELLTSWAGAEELVIAHHYFWNAGSTMQKSQIGLTRTLLYHIVRQFPAEAINIIPKRFQDYASPATMPWTQAELCACLEKFGKHRVLGTRLCFFIDGLDEFEGDHPDLVEYLAKLANCRSIKLCVSSRPWNTFARAYDQRVDGQLTVQDFTQDDIKTYAANQMNGSDLFRKLKHQSPGGCADLIRALSDKAEGVFLWVHLIIRSLLRGLNNDDDLAILERRLREHPDNLEKFFMRMFDRVEKVYQLPGARILLTAMTAGSPLPLFAPHLLDLEIGNKQYAIELPAGSSNPLWTGKPERLRRYLDARCGDLLEVTNDGINFVHRTARDFLDEVGIKAQLFKRAGPDFDAVQSLGNVLLARIKTFPADNEELGVLIAHLLDLAKCITPQQTPIFVTILDHLNDIGERLFLCSNGLAPDSIEKSRIYRDSRWSFQIQANLQVLRMQAPQVESNPVPSTFDIGQIDLDETERELLGLLSGHY